MTTLGWAFRIDEPPPAGFAAPLGFKDIRLALAAAEALRVPMPFASVLHDRFVELLAHGGEKMDWSAVGRLLLDGRVPVEEREKGPSIEEAGS